MDGGQKGQIMKKAQITIATTTNLRDCIYQTIDAYLDTSIPGLALHKGDQGWMVTHIKTGTSLIVSGVPCWPLRRQALEYARALCRCTDWTVENPAEQFRGYARYVVKHAKLAGLAAA